MVNYALPFRCVVQQVVLTASLSLEIKHTFGAVRTARLLYRSSVSRGRIQVLEIRLVLG